MSARRQGKNASEGDREVRTPGEADYPRRRTHHEPERPAASKPETGWRASKRSSKLGKQVRREARAEQRKKQLSEGVRATKNTAIGLAQIAMRVVLGLVAGVVVLFLLAVSVNAGARWLARRAAEEASTPEALAEQARENLLIIGVGESSADFLAVRLDEADEQILGIAIPSGAFMEVPGQGFERVGESYASGVGVSLAAVSNYLSVPFAHYVVVDAAIYQDALTNQSLRGVMAAVQASDLSADEQARIAKFIDSVSGDRTALVSLPLKPIDLGGQTYYEPQRDRIADLLMQWWGVKMGAEDTSVRVIIYNGVGTPGIAGEAAQQLIASGMRVVDTKNADRFDYDTTLVVVQSGALEHGDKVKAALGVGEIVDQPSEQDVADVVVIIGRDYVPPATP